MSSILAAGSFSALAAWRRLGRCAFPEIRQAALAQLPTGAGLDGELVVWENDRLVFERLQARATARGARAEAASREWPAHFVAVDLLHLGKDDLTRQGRRNRRPGGYPLRSAGRRVRRPHPTGPWRGGGCHGRWF
ncbi:hypothetical protein [Streptomyces sp. CB01881]|uniref:ATP-dependent DNA ligase n=1 Tax=Streptomyces sp. CB01881 TaxID=2078691 RepID=UPI003211D609